MMEGIKSITEGPEVTTRKIHEFIPKKSDKSISVLVPSYRLSPSCFIVSFFRLYEQLIKYYKVYVHFVENTYIPQARNMLAEYAIKDKSDYTIWIDDDSVFNSKDMIYLIDTFQYMSYHAITPLMYLKTGEKLAFTEDIPGFKAVSLPREKEWIDLKSTGFGFILMQTAILEELAKKHGFTLFQTHQEERRFTGEDIDFWRKFNAAGFKLGLNQYIVIGHYGGIIPLK